jgi:hypothetical protein
MEQTTRVGRVFWAPTTGSCELSTALAPSHTRTHTHAPGPIRLQCHVNRSCSSGLVWQVGGGGVLKAK